MNENLDCLDHSDACKGVVELRPAMSPTGRWFPRCEEHFDRRLREQERIVRTYGGSMFY